MTIKLASVRNVGKFIHYRTSKPLTTILPNTSYLPDVLQVMGYDLFDPEYCVALDLAQALCEGIDDVRRETV